MKFTFTNLYKQNCVAINVVLVVFCIICFYKLLKLLEKFSRKMHIDNKTNAIDLGPTTSMSATSTVNDEMGLGDDIDLPDMEKRGLSFPSNVSSAVQQINQEN